MNAAGGCACGAVRYELGATPLIVHACHCRDCQRVTGSAFVINVWLEREHVRSTGDAKPRSFLLRGGTGKDHEVFSCAACATYVWSRYEQAPGDALFVRAGTLDHPEAITPDVHIFTRTKLPWVELPARALAFETGYRIADVWSAESLGRLERLTSRRA